MCGIAGIIHKGKSTNVGGEMQQMLQSLKHRGPDSTGYALYGTGGTQDYILRFKVGENVKEGSSAIMEDASLYEKRRNEVNEKIVEAGGNIIKEGDPKIAYLQQELVCNLKISVRFQNKTLQFGGTYSKP